MYWDRHSRNCVHFWNLDMSWYSVTSHTSRCYLKIVYVTATWLSFFVKNNVIKPLALLFFKQLKIRTYYLFWPCWVFVWSLLEGPLSGCSERGSSLALRGLLVAAASCGKVRALGTSGHGLWARGLRWWLRVCSVVWLTGSRAQAQWSR